MQFVQSCFDNLSSRHKFLNGFNPLDQSKYQHIWNQKCSHSVVYYPTTNVWKSLAIRCVSHQKTLFRVHYSFERQPERCPERCPNDALQRTFCAFRDSKAFLLCLRFKVKYKSTIILCSLVVLAYTCQPNFLTNVSAPYGSSPQRSRKDFCGILHRWALGLTTAWIRAKSSTWKHRLHICNGKTTGQIWKTKTFFPKDLTVNDNRIKPVIDAKVDLQRDTKKRKWTIFVPLFFRNCIFCIRGIHQM